MSGSSPTRSLIVASMNPGKINELASLLEGRYRVVARPADLPDTVEDGVTLEQNALKKAAEVAAHVQMDALADDTGLFVDALDGRPGVHTARYAGPKATDAENRALLLRELQTVSASGRSGYFQTTIALVRSDGTSVVAEGSIFGHIAEAERGESRFGYDSLFVPDEGDGRTFAQMSKEEKNAISHRSRALQALLAQLA